MSDRIPALLEPIQNRLNAATPGPWEMRQCAPCTERGRLEVNIWDKAGNFLITNWCDDDPYEPADAVFIANAPTDQARLLAAVQAVTALAANWEARGEQDMAYSKTITDEDIAMALLTDGATMVENARHIRNALEAALGGEA